MRSARGLEPTLESVPPSNPREPWEPWDKVKATPAERPEARGLGGGLEAPDHEPERRWPRWIRRLVLGAAILAVGGAFLCIAGTLGVRRSTAFIGCALLLAGWLRLRSAPAPTPHFLRLQRQDRKRRGARQPSDTELSDWFREFRLLTGALLLALGATALMVALWPP